MRKRNNTVTVRVNDEELKIINERISLSGMTKQSYLINALMGAKTVTAEQISACKDSNLRIMDIQNQLRGMATNINQIARIANSTGQLPVLELLNQISEKLDVIRKENDVAWQPLRYYIANHAVRAV